ncbi:hypothetical protein [Antarctobacter sp.]|uniref:hypothetical protein n=1 Tax=Antarctobacter sp. TaxID=1872577 RepID=UPI002B266BF1|nr:hypothetical protein [Antarctobacter sp.]
MALMTLAAATIGLATFTTPLADTPEALFMAQAQPFITTQGISGPQGDYMTTPKGCTYRRTQAPGHPARWIIVQNPHHIGRPASPSHCKAML